MVEVSSGSDPRLTMLRALMNDAAVPYGFVELDPFGERHGSWQRTLHVSANSLDRYLMVAFTTLEDHDEISVIAGAEERTAPNTGAQPKFKRFDIGTIRLDDTDPEQWPRSELRDLFLQAATMALAIQFVQLEKRELLAS
ncbi:MAG TPA: hypothetical protein VFA65_21905 [Bryobacteraceae bacterium]|nr:hypothetical protein [Bryobacteraceae bacterium]